MDTSVLAGYRDVDIQVVREGQTIFLAGALGLHMFVVLDGQVEISVGGRVVDHIRAGGIFGEMALVDSRPRAGAAVAITAGKLLRLDEEQFLKLVHESPGFALKVLRTVVDRLRRANSNRGMTSDAPPPVDDGDRIIP